MRSQKDKHYDPRVKKHGGFHITYLGRALGRLGGLGIWQPLPALIPFGILGLLVVGIDEGLRRR